MTKVIRWAGPVGNPQFWIDPRLQDWRIPEQLSRFDLTKKHPLFIQNPMYNMYFGNDVYQEPIFDSLRRTYHYIFRVLKSRGLEVDVFPLDWEGGRSFWQIEQSKRLAIAESSRRPGDIDVNEHRGSIDSYNQQAAEWKQKILDEFYEIVRAYWPECECFNYNESPKGVEVIDKNGWQIHQTSTEYFSTPTYLRINGNRFRNWSRPRRGLDQMTMFVNAHRQAKQLGYKLAPWISSPDWLSENSTLGPDFRDMWQYMVHEILELEPEFVVIWGRSNHFEDAESNRILIDTFAEYDLT